MADENDRRLLRAGESYGRPAAPTASGASDPLAELARLIGQTDPFAEYGRQTARAPQPTAPAEPPMDWTGRPARTTGYAPPPVASEQPVSRRDQAYGSPPPYGAEANSPAGLDRFGANHFEAAPPPYAASGHDHAAEHDQDYATAPQVAGSYDPNAFYPARGMPQDEGLYDDEPPARRRISILAIAGIFALAVLGTAGAFGYRALFGSSGSAPPPVIKADTAPSKVVPATSGDARSSKLINDRIGERGQGEKMVSREEQPIELKDKVPQAIFPPVQGAAPAPQAAGVASLAEPKKIKTIAIRPDQPAGVEAEPVAARAAPVPQPPAARPANAPLPISATGNEPPASPAPVRQATTPAPRGNAPLSLNPNAAPAAPAAPVRTASAPPAAAGGGGYAVQVSSQRSEAEAQAAFRALQSKYPSQLNGRQAIVRRADLGSKGVYYRAMVGPFASADQASELCNSLKAAGAQCIVQRN